MTEFFNSNLRRHEQRFFARQNKDPRKLIEGVKRLVRLRAEFRHLENVAAHLAKKPRRSLRLQWKRHNARSIREQGGPWFTLILFGEEGYWSNGGPSLEGHNITIFPSRLPCPHVDNFLVSFCNSNTKITSISTEHYQRTYLISNPTNLAGRRSSRLEEQNILS